MTTRNNFRQFRSFGGIIAPRGDQVMPSHHRTVANVDTRNSICISSVSTEEATKFQVVSVSAIHVPTARTSTTGVLGRNQFECNPFGFGFVLREELSCATVGLTASFKKRTQPGDKNEGYSSIRLIKFQFFELIK